MHLNVAHLLQSHPFPCPVGAWRAVPFASLHTAWQRPWGLRTSQPPSWDLSSFSSCCVCCAGPVSAHGLSLVLTFQMLASPRLVVSRPVQRGASARCPHPALLPPLPVKCVRSLNSGSVSDRNFSSSGWRKNWFWVISFISLYG